MSPASAGDDEPTRILPCPCCRKPTPWGPSNKHRPFCSERCRLIDFGGWANESNRIVGDDPFDDAARPDDWRDDGRRED